MLKGYYNNNLLTRVCSIRKVLARQFCFLVKVINNQLENLTTINSMLNLLWGPFVETWPCSIVGEIDWLVRHHFWGIEHVWLYKMLFLASWQAPPWNEIEKQTTNKILGHHCYEKRWSLVEVWLWQKFPLSQSDRK